MNLHAIIVDDERIARQRLRRMLGKHPEIEVVAECASGREAVQTIQRAKPDVLFLDVQMPEMNGFDVLNALGPSQEPAVIFVTAFDEHAIRAFETCALDYLLKPVAKERLAKSVSRIRTHVESHRGVKERPIAPSQVGKSGDLRFSVRSGLRTSFVSPQEIDWIEADGNYAILHVGSRNHLVRETMTALEAQLSSAQFLRLNRSAIVQLNRVKEIQSAPAGHHFAILMNGQRVPLTRRVREVQERLRAIVN